MNADTESLEFSAAPHLPGRTPRPDDGVFEAFKRGLSPALDPDELAFSPAFRGGLDAFRQRYYWEAHELWEAVWTCLPPASAERHLLRGLIQLSNAGLKGRMGREAAHRRILDLAGTALAEAFLREAGQLMGMGRDQVESLRAQSASESPN